MITWIVNDTVRLLHVQYKDQLHVRVGRTRATTESAKIREPPHTIYSPGCLQLSLARPEETRRDSQDAAF